MVMVISLASFMTITTTIVLQTIHRQGPRGKPSRESLPLSLWKGQSVSCGSRRPKFADFSCSWRKRDVFDPQFRASWYLEWSKDNWKWYSWLWHWQLWWWGKRWQHHQWWQKLFFSRNDRVVSISAMRRHLIKKVWLRTFKEICRGLETYSVIMAQPKIVSSQRNTETLSVGKYWSWLWLWAIFGKVNWWWWSWSWSLWPWWWWSRSWWPWWWWSSCGHFRQSWTTHSLMR